MNIPETFTAVFYDDRYPFNLHHAMYKKLDRKQWLNLADGIQGKTVQLRAQSGEWLDYKITSQMDFNIDGIVQNQTFGVFICKKQAPIKSLWQGA